MDKNETQLIMAALGLLVLLIFGLFFVNNQTLNGGQANWMQGEVEHLALNGGCLRFTSDREETYELIGEYVTGEIEEILWAYPDRKARIAIQGNIKKDIATTCMVGTPFEVTRYEFLTSSIFLK